VRQRIVKSRLAFDTDPEAFRALHEENQAALGERIAAARAALNDFDFDDAVHARVSELCIAAQVDGLRADLVMLRAARALAALEGADYVETKHVECVAEAVLRHRRRETEAPPRETPPRQANGASEQDGEWGYVPPEPAGTAKVKQVRPLAAKKA
jgi:magnesium chelatase subunit I